MKKRFELVLFSLLLCSCSKKNIVSERIIAKDIEAFSYFDSDNNPVFHKVQPFNTSMYLTYYFDSKNDYSDSLNKINEIYNNSLYENHIYFDRHAKYLNSENEFVINLKTINDSFGSGENVKIPENLYTLLKFGKEMFYLTDGYFNMFTGRITDYWDECFYKAYDYEDLDTFDPYFSSESKLKLENIVNEIPKTDEDFEAQLSFDDVNKTVRFNKLSNQSSNYHPLISLGGIAKGFATDLVKEELIKNDYKNGILMSGGSSISLISDPTFIKNPKKGQSFSVINPLKMSFFTNETAFTIYNFKEFNSSTSGNYTINKNYKINDENGNTIIRYHIINPNTGYSEQFHYQITAVSNTLSNGLLDALTTSLMCLNIEDGMKLRNKVLEKYPNSDLHIYWMDNVNGKCKLYASDKELDLKLGEDVSVVYEE